MSFFFFFFLSGRQQLNSIGMIMLLCVCWMCFYSHYFSCVHEKCYLGQYSRMLNTLFQAWQTPWNDSVLSEFPLEEGCKDLLNGCAQWATFIQILRTQYPFLHKTSMVYCKLSKFGNYSEISSVNVFWGRKCIWDIYEDTPSRIHPVHFGKKH